MSEQDDKPGGWYAMKRGWLTHEIFEPVGKWSKAEAWVWMVEHAAFRPTVIDIGGKPYTVPRGSLCYSERFIAQKFKWSRKAVQTFINQLSAHGVVEKAVAKTGTGTKSKRVQISLCNYEKYQSIGTKREPKGNQKGTKEEQVNNKQTSLSEESGDSKPIEVSVVTTALWNVGKQYLSKHGLENPGAVIGRWLKTSEPVAILTAIEAAQKSGTQDPIPYITELLKGGPNGKRETASERKARERLEAFLAGARGAS